MRTLLKLAAICAVLVGSLMVAAACWLFYYSGGLPDLTNLKRFAPVADVTVQDPCISANNPIWATPYNSLGTTMRGALSVATTREDAAGIVSSYAHAIIGDWRQQQLPASFLVSKTAICEATGHRTTVRYQLDLLRMSAQLEQRFTAQDLFAMLANRSYFAEGQYGVKDAAEHFFHKKPSELNIADAALLAGLSKAPGPYSPRLHPDAALKRRNQVIDKMIAAHLINASDGAAAKASALTIVPVEAR